MADWILVILSSALALAGGFVIIYLRDILLDKKKTRGERERDLIEKRLDKLYSQLYRNIRTCEIVFNKKSLVTGKSADEKGEGWESVEMKKLINNGFYLASEELQPLLAEYYYSFKKRNESEIKDKNTKLVELIKKEYEEMREKYFNIN